jgi:hypothetical protein
MAIEAATMVAATAVVNLRVMALSIRLTFCLGALGLAVPVGRWTKYASAPPQRLFRPLQD